MVRIVSDQLIELQTRIAFQEQALEEMNRVVTKQQDQIDALIRELKNLREQYESLARSPGAASVGDDRPPHN